MQSKKKIVLVTLLLFLVLPSSLQLPVYIIPKVLAQGHTDPLIQAITEVNQVLEKLGAYIDFKDTSVSFTIYRNQIISAFGSEAGVMDAVRRQVSSIVFHVSQNEMASRLGAILMIYKNRVLQDFPDLANIQTGEALWSAVVNKLGDIRRAQSYVADIATQQITKEILEATSHTRIYDGILYWYSGGVTYSVLVEWKSVNDISVTQNILYSIRESILDVAIVKSYKDARLVWILHDYPLHQSELFRLLRTNGIGAFTNYMWTQQTVYGYSEGMGIYEIIRGYLKTNNPDTIYESVQEFIPKVKYAVSLAETGKARLRLKPDYMVYLGLAAEIVASLWKPVDSTQAMIHQALIKFSQATRLTVDALMTAKGLGMLALALIGEGGSFFTGGLMLADVMVFYVIDYTRASHDFEDLYNQVLSGANSPKIYRISQTLYRGVDMQLVGVETDNLALPRYLFIFVNGNLVRIAKVDKWTYRFSSEDFGARIDMYGVHITLGLGDGYFTDILFADYQFVETRTTYSGDCYKDDRYLFTYTWEVPVKSVFFLETPPVKYSSTFLGSSGWICPPPPDTGSSGSSSSSSTDTSGYVGGLPPRNIFLISIFGINITLPCYIDIFNIRINMPYCKNP